MCFRHVPAFIQLNLYKSVLTLFFRSKQHPTFKVHFESQITPNKSLVDLETTSQSICYATKYVYVPLFIVIKASLHKYQSLI